MAKQSELYGMGYKKGFQDCWKEVLRYLTEANKQGAIRFENMAVLTLQHYLTMLFDVKLDLKQVFESVGDSNE